MILGVRTIILVFRQTSALHFFDLLNSSQINAFRIVDPAGGIAHGDYLAAELLCLLAGIDLSLIHI